MKKLLRLVLGVVAIGVSLQPCYAENMYDDFDGLTKDEAAVLCVKSINMFRATENVPPVRPESDERRYCANNTADKDSKVRDQIHPHSTQCGNQAQNTCLDYTGAAGAATEACIKSLWDEKYKDGVKGHYLILKNKDFKTVACGIYRQPNGKIWLNQNFYK